MLIYVSAMAIGSPDLLHPSDINMNDKVLEEPIDVVGEFSIAV